MVIYYDEDHLRNRQETFLRDEKGIVLYRGIYDFSYKYRTRIFRDPIEAAYVELDITSESPRVLFCDPDGKKIRELIRKDGLYLDEIPVEKNGSGFLYMSASAKDGVLDTGEEDILTCVLLLFAMIEIERKK